MSRDGSHVNFAQYCIGVHEFNEFRAYERSQRRRAASPHGAVSMARLV